MSEKLKQEFNKLLSSTKADSIIITRYDTDDIIFSQSKDQKLFLPLDKFPTTEKIYNKDVFYNKYLLGTINIVNSKVSVEKIANFIKDSNVEELVSQYIINGILLLKMNLCTKQQVSLMSNKIHIDLKELMLNINYLSFTDVNQQQKKFIDNISTTSIAVTKTINDFIENFKLINGFIYFDRHIFSIPCIIKGVENILNKVKTNHKNIFSIDETMPKFIISDRDKIIQILLNLNYIFKKFNLKHSSSCVSFKYEKDYDKSILKIKVNGNWDVIDHVHIFNEKNLNNVIKCPDEMFYENLKYITCLQLVDIVNGKMDFCIDNNNVTFTIDIPINTTDDLNTIFKTFLIQTNNKNVLYIDDDVKNRLKITPIILEIGLTPYICTSIDETKHYLKYGNFYLIIINICNGMNNYDEIIEYSIKYNVPLVVVYDIYKTITFKINNELCYTIQNPIEEMSFYNILYQLYINFNKDEVVI